MIKRIKKWFADRRAAQFEAYIKQRDEAAKEVAEKLQAAVDKAITEKNDALKTSEEPWVNLESIEYDAEQGIKMKLDWNAAFIRYLRNECGFSGTDDEAIVQQYIGTIAQESYEAANDNRLAAVSEKLKE